MSARVAPAPLRSELLVMETSLGLDVWLWYS